MVLSNYWKAFEICTIFNANDNGNVKHKDFGLIDTDGNLVGSICYQAPFYATSLAQVVSNIHLRVFDEIRVGSGKGQIDVTDYGLFNDITNKVSEPRFTVANSVMDDGISTVVIYSGKNLTNESFTITEMGVCKTFYSFNQSTGGVVAKNPVMLAKVQLEKPIIVQPNQPFTFNCEWIEK